MVTRSVNVRLTADVSRYTASMRTAARNTSQVANAGAVVGTALVAGFAVAAASAAKFDKELSNVRSVTGATGKEMQQLRSAALEAGKTTSFTATEAARAEAELARAGVKTADIIGGALKGSLALAAAGQVDLTEAAVVSAQAMNTFGLAGKDVTHIADLLAAGANKSAADVHGLAMSLRMGGLLAHQTGLSIEDTVGTLAAFADHALIGSDAGTSLKVMLQRLVPQSKEAAEMMAQIGFSAYDSKGEFVGLNELAGRMKTSFSQLTPEARNAAMATIFGADAVRSATIMYELGADGIKKYVDAVNDQGAAGRMASIQTDNLIGDLERLRGAIETALIEGGSAANGTLRTMTQWVTNAVNAYNSLSPEVQHAVTLFMGFGGAVALVGAGILLLIPRIAATRAALVSMGVTAARTRTALGMLGQVGLVVAGLELISYASQKVREQFADAPPSVSKMASSLVDLGKTGKIGGEGLKSLGADLDGFGEAVKRVAHPDWEARTTDIVNSITFGLTEGIAETQIPLQEARDKIKSVDEALGQLAQSGNAQLASDAFNRLAAAAAEDGTSKEKLLTLLPQYTDALAGMDVQSKTNATSQEQLAQQLGLTADQLKDQRTEAERLSDALSTLNGVAISSAEKEIGFRQSLADLTDTVKENGRSLDVTSEKGRRVKSAFLDAASAAMAHAEAVASQKNSQAAGQAVLEKDIGLLREQMRAANFSEDAIERLIVAYAQLPLAVKTDIKANTSAAVRNLEEVKHKLQTTKGKTVTVDALTKDARKALEDLGYKIKTTNGKQLTITAPTGAAQGDVRALAAAIAELHGRTLTVTTVHRTVQSNSLGRPQAGEGNQSKHATGGIIRGYAAGGDVQWMPWGGPVYGPGTERSDSVPTWLSRGEYVIKAASVRKYGAAMFDRLNAGRFANGGLLGGSFSYAPNSTAVLGGPGNAKERYDTLVQRLRDAFSDLAKALADLKKKTDALKDAEKKQAATRKEGARKVGEAEDNLARVRRGKHTKSQLLAAEKRLADARRSAAKADAAAADRTKSARNAKRAADTKVKQERSDVNNLDRQLGLKDGAKAPTSFNLTAYQKQLTASLAATTTWRNNLAKIGKRGGQEIKDLLESMGEDGYALVNSLAGASDKQFRDIVAKLKATGATAKATLADFTSQLGGATKESRQFAADLQKLAAQGFGDLAQALAAQGDSTAMTLAHEAAKSPTAAAAANKAVGQAQSTLTGEDLANSLVLLSTLRSAPGRGYAELAAAGLDMAVLKKLVPRMMAQINALPTAYKSVFLKQWAGQGGVVAMARGGILTQPSLVLGGEAGVPESWIPHDGSARSRMLLSRTAARMGYQLTPAARYRGTGPASGGAGTTVTRTYEVHLHGAKQTTAEQAMDVARQMSLIS
ncbi:TP901 family phage tail tape measure protein [Streptomyces sp. PvR006]|uniref:phage tail tape measure protein n=1 Tax=Streptomyces sp. PvR006 TaxID=2817860 RepID=UPI001AEAED23|nr:phage tail tape measure protein [Streptomyces sp. PvR006]MBP2583038.1 TP901 family phage tail tape measure protein [Streptomyces sp. PvR006]